MIILAQEGGFRLPTDECVLDVKRDFGAKGDGVTDDTEALQKGLDASAGQGEVRSGKSSVLWIPNGTYRVTRSLVFKHALGPWLYGESRDGVIIKLDDNAEDVTAVLRTHPNEKGPTSADWFMRNLRHFTIDVGNNPETDGIRYHASVAGTVSCSSTLLSIAVRSVSFASLISSKTLVRSPMSHDCAPTSSSQPISLAS